MDLVYYILQFQKKLLLNQKNSKYIIMIIIIVIIIIYIFFFHIYVQLSFSFIATQSSHAFMNIN